MSRADFARSILVASMSGASATSLSRMLWTRALPGSVAVIAALSVPGLSLGAGFLAQGQPTGGAQGNDAKAAALQVSPVIGSGRAYGEGARKSLRAMLAPWAAPDARQNYAAERAGLIAPLASPLSPVELAMRVPEASAASAASAALAVSSVRPPVQALSAATLATTAPKAAPVQEPGLVQPAILAGNIAASDVPAAPVAAALPSRAYGETSSARAAPVLSASSPPEAALSLRDGMIGVGAATRASAPGRREALAPIAAPPLPIAAPAPALAASPVPLSVSASVSAEALAPVSAAVPAAVMVMPPFADKRPAPPVAARPRAAPAALSSAVRGPAGPAPALAPLPRAKLQPPASVAGRADALRVDVRSQLLTRIDGKTAGKVDFQQTDAGLQVRLGSIVDLLGDRYGAAQIARIRASSASNVYLPLAQLQAQGIPISYDPVYDEFNVGTTDARPKARLKVHMDQITTPERGLGSTAVEQVRR